MDTFSTCGGIASVQWEITSVLWRVFSTVGKILNFGMFDHDIFCSRKLNFHSEVSKILADFMHFKRWTGVLRVQPCFEIIDYCIFGMLYLSFKFNCLCDCT